MGLLSLFDRILGGGYSTLPPVSESKFLGLIDDQRAIIMTPSLVHGPGASGPDVPGDGNSAVFACLMALSMGTVEPSLRVHRHLSVDRQEWLPDHPLQQLLDRPNPFMDGRELRFWMQWARHSHGNAYLRKVRSGNDLTGNVVELWPISPARCGPIRYDRSTNYIDAYRYHYAPGKHEDIPIGNIVHIRNGVDSNDDRLGMSALRRLTQLVASDEEAAKFAAALLKNYAVPGLVVMPAKDTEISRDQAEDLKARITASLSGDNRGHVSVLSNGADVKQFGFSPNDLDLKALHQIPEARICAVMRVPPAVAGLSVGLEQTSNYASFREVREMFAESTLAPEWAMDESKLNQQLVPDFDRSGRIELHYDLSEVRALQEDVNAKVTRLQVGVAGGWILPNEARQEIGMEPLPELDQRPAAVDQPPALRIVKALEGKQFSPTALPVLFEALADLAEPQFRADMETYLDAQRREVRRRVAGNG